MLNEYLLLLPFIVSCQTEWLDLRGHVTALKIRFMAGRPILILMASLTFLFNQTSDLASTLSLTLSLVILLCSCAQCFCI